MIKIMGKCKRDFIQHLKVNNHSLYLALPPEAGDVGLAMYIDEYSELGVAYMKSMNTECKLTERRALTELDRISAEFNSYVKLESALAYGAGCDAGVMASVPTIDGKFMFKISREELLSLVSNKRKELYEQLSGV